MEQINPYYDSQNIEIFDKMQALKQKLIFLSNPNFIEKVKLQLPNNDFIQYEKDVNNLIIEYNNVIKFFDNKNSDAKFSHDIVELLQEKINTKYNFSLKEISNNNNDYQNNIESKIDLYTVNLPTVKKNILRDYQNFQKSQDELIKIKSELIKHKDNVEYTATLKKQAEDIFKNFDEFFFYKIDKINTTNININSTNANTNIDIKINSANTNVSVTTSPTKQNVMTTSTQQNVNSSSDEAMNLGVNNIITIGITIVCIIVFLFFLSYINYYHIENDKYKKIRNIKDSDAYKNYINTKLIFEKNNFIDEDILYKAHVIYNNIEIILSLNNQDKKIYNNSISRIEELDKELNMVTLLGKDYKNKSNNFKIKNTVNI